MKISILDKKRQALLRRLNFLKNKGFYLAGGTALALQFGHRLSLDFDFYTKESFASQALYKELYERFKKLTLIQIAEDTLIVSVDNIEISFFHYDYPLVRPLIKGSYLNLASLEDIACMKIAAIAQRGTKRDFIDIYFLIEKLGLKEILEFVGNKYHGFDKYVALQGLSYFEDAEKDRTRTIRTIKHITWSKIKKKILEEIKIIKKEDLK